MAKFAAVISAIGSETVSFTLIDWNSFIDFVNPTNKMFSIICIHIVLIRI